MSNQIIDRFVRDIPRGWRPVSIGDALRLEPVLMRDSELYRLVSIRRRNGGMFLRNQLYGRRDCSLKLSESYSWEFRNSAAADNSWRFRSGNG